MFGSRVLVREKSGLKARRPATYERVVLPQVEDRKEACRRPPTILMVRDSPSGTREQYEEVGARLTDGRGLNSLTRDSGEERHRLR